MSLIRQKLASARQLNFPSVQTDLEVWAIGKRQLSLIIHPVIGNYQIIHKATGLHVSFFYLAEFAMQCFLELEREIPLFSGVPNSEISEKIKNTVKHFQWEEYISDDYPEEREEE